MERQLHLISSYSDYLTALERIESLMEKENRTAVEDHIFYVLVDAVVRYEEENYGGSD